MRCLLLVIVVLGVSGLDRGCSGDKSVPNFQAMVLSSPASYDQAVAKR